MSGTNGNGSKGKRNPHLRPPFKPGNPGGPGNPWARLTQQLKSAILKAAKKPHDEGKNRAQALGEQLWEMALGSGHQDDKTQAAKRWAMQQILDRGLGKPKEHHQIDGEVTVTVADFFRQAAERARSMPN